MLKRIPTCAADVSGNTRAATTRRPSRHRVDNRIFVSSPWACSWGPSSCLSRCCTEIRHHQNPTCLRFRSWAVSRGCSTGARRDVPRSTYLMRGSRVPRRGRPSARSPPTTSHARMSVPASTRSGTTATGDALRPRRGSRALLRPGVDHGALHERRPHCVRARPQRVPGDKHVGRCPSGDRQACWYNSITLARSTDGGRTFSQRAPPGHLVASVPYPYEPDAGPFGLFGPSNIVYRAEDQHYYALIQAQRYGAQRAGTCVIRTARLDRPGAWRAWDGDELFRAVRQSLSRRCVGL